jgi:hypothetical protein
VKLQQQIHSQINSKEAISINNLHDREINATRAFHKQRIMFVFHNGELHIKYHTEQSHIEWFLQEGWIQDMQDEKFNDLIRGYYDKTGIYFYKGHAFSTDKDLENFVVNLKKTLQLAIKQPGLPVYCGVTPSKLGEIFKPVKFMYVL